MGTRTWENKVGKIIVTTVEQWISLPDHTALNNNLPPITTHMARNSNWEQDGRKRMSTSVRLVNFLSIWSGCSLERGVKFVKEGILRKDSQKNLSQSWSNRTGLHNTTNVLIQKWAVAAHNYVEAVDETLFESCINEAPLNFLNYLNILFHRRRPNLNALLQMGRQ